MSRLGEAGTTLSATLVTWGLMNILPLVIVLLAVQPTPETTKVWTDAGRNLPAEYDEVVLQVQLWTGVIALGLGLMLFALLRPARHIGLQGPARSHPTVDPWRARSSPQKGRRPHRSKRRKP